MKESRKLMYVFIIKVDFVYREKLNLIVINDKNEVKEKIFYLQNIKEFR